MNKKLKNIRKFSMATSTVNPILQKFIKPPPGGSQENVITFKSERSATPPPKNYGIHNLTFIYSDAIKKALSEHGMMIDRLNIQKQKQHDNNDKDNTQDTEIQDLCDIYYNVLSRNKELSPEVINTKTNILSRKEDRKHGRIPKSSPKPPRYAWSNYSYPTPKSVDQRSVLSSDSSCTWMSLYTPTNFDTKSHTTVHTSLSSTRNSGTYSSRNSHSARSTWTCKSATSRSTLSSKSANSSDRSSPLRRGYLAANDQGLFMTESKVIPVKQKHVEFQTKHVEFQTKHVDFKKKHVEFPAITDCATSKRIQDIQHNFYNVNGHRSAKPIVIM